MNEVKLTLLGGFHIYADGVCMDELLAKSRKGVQLMQYLILEKDQLVPNFRLIETIWQSDDSANPESALKTLISRLRVLLGQCAPGLGQAIVGKRGGYIWQNNEHITVDVYRFEELHEKLHDAAELTPETEKGFRELMNVYGGDLLPGANQDDWLVARSVRLHDQYIRCIYQYLSLLSKAERFDDIVHVSRSALEIEPFDERLHLELMNALVKTERNNEALMQYKHVTNLHFRYLGVKPPEGIQEFYKRIMQAGQSLSLNIDSIRRELREYGDMKGAFVCEYAVFRDIYNLQIRSLERVGMSMYIGLIMISSIDNEPIDPLKLDDIMRGLENVLVSHLRKGDTLTHYSASQYALLLPTVNNETAKMVMERIKRFFYQKYPNSSVLFHYRVGSLTESIEP